MKIWKAHESRKLIAWEGVGNLIKTFFVAHHHLSAFLCRHRNVLSNNRLRYRAAGKFAIDYDLVKPQQRYSVGDGK